jgi:NAD(P)-dependent dehydrogenase (short-subunit alcohol dehydrogenase family)
MNRFKSKVAIVTGAGCVGSGWGNGRAMAVQLAQEGACVFAVDRDPERLAETLELAGEFKGAIETYACDVTSAESIQKMVQACLDKFGTIDILINNVGGSAAGGPVEMSEEVFDSQINVNLKSVFLTFKNVLPTMIAKKKWCDCQCRVHIRHSLDGQRAGGLCRHQGGCDSTLQSGGGSTCPHGHPREHRGAWPTPHAHGGGAFGQATHGRRCGGAVGITRQTHSFGLHGRWPRHGQCRFVLGQ